MLGRGSLRGWGRRWFGRAGPGRDVRRTWWWRCGSAGRCWGRRRVAPAGARRSPARPLALAEDQDVTGPIAPRTGAHPAAPGRLCPQRLVLNLGKAKVQPSRANLNQRRPRSRCRRGALPLRRRPRPPATLHTDRDRAVRHRGAARELPGPTLERRQRPTSCRATGRSRVRRSGLDNYRASAGQRCRRDPHSRDHQSPPDRRRLGWPASHRPLNSCANRLKASLSRAAHITPRSGRP